jgi:hypothetical protein
MRESLQRLEGNGIPCNCDPREGIKNEVELIDDRLHLFILF